MYRLFAWRWLVLSFLVVILDQWSKWEVVSHFQRGELHPILPMLNIALSYNQGIAFSWFASSALWVRQSLILVSMGIVAFLLYVQSSTEKKQWGLHIALACMIGGALGNIIDKITIGYVVDFIDIYAGSWHFATFNMADAAISLGGVYFAYDAWFENARG